MHYFREDDLLQFAMECKSCHSREAIIKNIVDLDPESRKDKAQGLVQELE